MGQIFPSKNILLRGKQTSLTLRPFHSPEEFAACVELQEETWGKGFSERVPASILMVNQKIGGVSAGAFDEQNTLQGFVFGMTGVKQERRVHWSDMLAVKPEFRNAGLGQQLKLYQRECVLRLGVEEIYWTYDPLVARNAHLNLNRLGASIEEYVVDMYPDDAASQLHRGLGMDRFVVVWNIRSAGVEARLTGSAETPASGAFEKAPVVNPDGSAPDNIEKKEGHDAGEAVVRIEIPSDIHAVRARSGEEAVQWRRSTRSAFLHFLQQGYSVFAIVPDRRGDRWHYILRSGG